jgi:hypothetical protein
MAAAEYMARITVDAGRAFQTIDGFGVNINSKYWNASRLIPTLDRLRDDLGATLYRVDIFGKSNWPDPDGALGPAALEPERLAPIYRGGVARDGWAMMRYLNEHGIEPYLTVSGDLPRWMLGPDGRTLADEARLCEMLVSLVRWARREEHLSFRLFGPLNETDLGSPEGPIVPPEAYVRVLLRLDEQLSRAGLDDITLVVAEQSRFDPTYLAAIVAEPQLARRVAVFGMHCYGAITPERFAEVRAAASGFASARLWMTEYGDLDQSGEKEWYVAWMMTERLFNLLEGGFQAALVWDAYDNYHDHDEAWTIYGLLRTGLRVHTPKLRYYTAKQVFRYVQPGFQRIAVETATSGMRLLAFASPEQDQLTIVGMNDIGRPANLNIVLEGFPETLLSGSVTYYRSGEQERCHTIGRIPVRGPNWPFNGIDVLVPPDCVFTLTTVA